MKLSYQLGQVHALMTHGIRPSSIYCVSSGIVVAALVASAMRYGHSLRSHYEDLLIGHATRGRLPKLPQSRRLIAEYISVKCLEPYPNGPSIIALGTQRSSYQPFLADLLVCHRADFLEALMSIPFVADSAASRLLHIADGGFEHNTPHHIMSQLIPSLVLSHFPPKSSHLSSFDRLPLAEKLSYAPIIHGYRLLWAYINTTFPHANDLSIADWIYPRYGCGLNFFSRSLAQHLGAIGQGIEDVEAWLANCNLRFQHFIAKTLRKPLD
jgi:hypothetical protein